MTELRVICMEMMNLWKLLRSPTERLQREKGPRIEFGGTPTAKETRKK